MDALLHHLSIISAIVMMGLYYVPKQEKQVFFNIQKLCKHNIYISVSNNKIDEVQYIFTK